MESGWDGTNNVLSWARVNNATSYSVRIADLANTLFVATRQVTNFPIPRQFSWGPATLSGTIIARSNVANRIDSPPSSAIVVFAPRDTNTSMDNRGSGVVQLGNFGGVNDLLALADDSFSGVLNVGGSTFDVVGKPESNAFGFTISVPTLPDDTVLTDTTLFYIVGAAVIILVRRS